MLGKIKEKIMIMNFLVLLHMWEGLQNLGIILIILRKKGAGLNSTMNIFDP